MAGLVAALDAFRGRRVFITGDTGFKGSWLALWMHELGAEVVGFALPPEGERCHFQLLGLERLIRHVDGNICDADALGRAFRQHRPEFVFHLAAQALVWRSYRDPKTTFDTNVGGSVNVLELVRESSDVRALVFVTSDKCYANKEWIWSYRENDELGGHDPYSASKAAAEIVFAGYLRAFFSERAGMGAASVRSGNVVGGGDWSDHRIVPDIARAHESGTSVVLRQPLSVRPWHHVLDLLSGYLQLAHALAHRPAEFNGAWNFGPSDNKRHSVHELAQRLLALWGGGRIEERASEIHETAYLSLNCDKALRQLDWRGRWDFERTIAETAAWYREVAAGVPAREVSLRQIRTYQEATK